MMVMPASRMLSAISFGVFCRAAPSTSAIMRSMKVEPGAAVILTLIWSEITWVPPVTAERDRAQHPAGRHDYHLRLRRGDDPELCRLCQRQYPGAGAGGFVRHPDPDHHRRAA